MSVIKDLVYEQDYKDFEKQFPDILGTDAKKAALEAERELTEIVRGRFREMPHIISPESKANFDACEGKLDRLTWLRGGRIRSIISYTNYDARIVVEIPNSVFVKASLEILQFVTSKAQWVKIESVQKDWMRIIVNIAYFANIGDTSAVVEEELDNHPEAIELSDASYEVEKNIMLSDPGLYATIASISEEMGMTPDEYYDHMEAFLKANPQIYEEIIEEALKKKRDRQRYECDPETLF